MARRNSSDFNTRVHDVFERIGRGEPSPNRLNHEEMAAALQAVEQSRQITPPTDSSDKPSN